MQWNEMNAVINIQYLWKALWPKQVLIFSNFSSRRWKKQPLINSPICVNYWAPRQPANRILYVFQFYALRCRARLSKLSNGTYRSRVMAYSYRTAVRSSWDWERHGSHTVPTCQEGKVRDSSPRTDEVLTVRDGLPRCCGVAEVKNGAENYSCSFALADMHSRG